MNWGLLNRSRDLNHERARGLLSDYLDRRLAPPLAAKLELHLRSCEECAAELGTVRATRQLLHALPPMRLPRSFTLEAAPRPVLLPPAFFFLRTAAATAAAAFVALLAASVVLPTAVAPGAMPTLYQQQEASAPRAADGALAQRQESPAVGPQQALEKEREKARDLALGREPAAAQAPERPAPAERAAAPAAPAPAAPPAPAAAAAQPPAAAARGVSPTPLASRPGPAAEALRAAPAAAPPGSVPASPAAASIQPEAATGTQAATDAGSSRAEPEPGARPGAPEPTRELHAAEAPSSASAPERPSPSLSAVLPVLQLLAGGLAALLALATIGLWWGHRRRLR